MAEIIGEIQQYENQPYCLSPYPRLKEFIETLGPFPSWSEKEVTELLPLTLSSSPPPHLLTPQATDYLALHRPRAARRLHHQAAQPH